MGLFRVATISYALLKRNGDVPTGRKCAFYAKFTQNIPRGETDAMFFGLYLLVLVFLYTAAATYNQKVQRAPNPDMEKGPTESETENDGGKEENKEGRRGRASDKLRLAMSYKALIVATICFMLSSLATVISVYAIMGIWFCHHEDLISLYWGFWLLGIVGSDIAILGIIVNEMHVLFGAPRPIYALALATPIPVLVGCINFVHQGSKKMAMKQVDRMERIDSQASDGTRRTAVAAAPAPAPATAPVQAVDSSGSVPAAECLIVPFRVPGNHEVRWREARHLPADAVRVCVSGRDSL
ncbi:hypothetical protein PVAG01_07353 [Phlyctema vagabunda]|uniref:Uncharacterized protein n=1 Tax=Phlyctema vagabunda TaxID=108571 RepID=A0ABR4PC92_9HELO